MSLRKVFYDKSTRKTVNIIGVGQLSLAFQICQCLCVTIRETLNSENTHN